MTERGQDKQLRLLSSGALFLFVLGFGGFACLLGHFLCLVLGWFCFKEQTCSMPSAMTSHWALSVQLQLRGDLHHKNPINWAPPLQSHRNPAAAGRGLSPARSAGKLSTQNSPGSSPVLLSVHKQGRSSSLQLILQVIKELQETEEKRINKIRNKKAVLMCKSSGAFQ